MTFDAIFNILYTTCKFQKTLKNNILIDRNNNKQLNNKWISSFDHWDNKETIFTNNQVNIPRQYYTSF